MDLCHHDVILLSSKYVLHLNVTVAHEEIANTSNIPIDFVNKWIKWKYFAGILLQHIEWLWPIFDTPCARTMHVYDLSLKQAA